MKPLIGITGNIRQDKETNHNISWRYSYSLHDFSQLVYQAGGIPVTLPLLDDGIAGEMIEKLDGLILSGGEDIHPLLYQQEPQTKLGPLNLRRDQFELSLLKQALEQDKAILGICRGIQLINVYFGGSLYQDLQSLEPSYLQHRQQSDLSQAHHHVQIQKDSYLAQLLPDIIKVNSYHHQAIHHLAKSLTATAYSPDGLVEAVEYLDKDHSLLAVQWHPEIQAQGDPEQFKLFTDLVERSKK